MSNPRKPIFDAVRAVNAGAFNKAGAVETLDTALDKLGIPREQAQGRKIGSRGINLIKEFEGCHKKRADGNIEAYPDPGTGGVPWTIGWGTTRMDGRAVVRGDVITQAKADKLLEDDLVKYAKEVEAAITAPTTQDQFDALVSFHYNTGAIATSTLTKKHNARDYEGAAQEFGRWNKAGGKVMAGLTRRRAAEAMLYRSLP